MAQIFSRRATTTFRVLLTLAPLVIASAGLFAYAWSRSDQVWRVGKAAPQPIPFRHDLHSGELKIDCRHCHASVERAAAAGMPSAEACLGCHARIWAGASVLEPLRSAVALNQAVHWSSVSRLPEYVAFHHGIHVAKGVACETCHGRVDQMTKTVKARTLSMGWCLDCHRDPAPRLRPLEEVFTFGWEPHRRDLPDGLRLLYAQAAGRLTSCNTCHR